ncbi:MULTISPECIES: 5-carboxymethyl-2-hydroxymuconate Delta-isomerase [unclassified Moritella]|uniref:5-carboxymethyl-2-hydroxymuconate Delta-isomerase n=1 Tax=unclassified Moritella TaxID=2637987 RepID=UPI001BA78196|nr:MULTISPECIES: 5-carboxymethyl-2-hydroxymuconate Delta-isomerase [unclassified Moritella]QUM80513.1 5-carboxymethyl-2-hydroxymuconate Delta-isomerase [Moritella sp. 5]QUM84780.1 5-carboxymethyl-2-hydroxymuconate Delta-isomerase [Moritella sp. 28]
MPHFVIDCSESILEHYSEAYILEQIHVLANSSGLFNEKDIKVRMNPFSTYLVANQREDFIHIFSHIMQGRTTEQKAALSRLLVTRLIELFPGFSHITMNVAEFEKATYCNRNTM